MSSGKFFGFIIGAALGGPIGAGIGTYLGSLSDDQEKEKEAEKNLSATLKYAIRMGCEDGAVLAKCPHCSSIIQLKESGEFWNCAGCNQKFQILVSQIELNRAKDEARVKYMENVKLGHWVRIENQALIIECPHCLSLSKNQACGEFWKCRSCDLSYQFKIDQDDINYALKNESRNHKDGTIYAFYILGAVAKADGKVSESEIEYSLKLMDAFAFNEESKTLAKKAFQLGRDQGNYSESAKSYYNIYYGCNEVIFNFVQGLLSMALADGILAGEEQRIIYDISVNHFGISQDYYFRMVSDAKYDQESEYEDEDEHSNENDNSINGLSAIQKAYAILGCSLEETLPNIKSKYKNLCMQYHPDKISSLNLAPEFEMLATAKIKEINSAYDLIINHLKINNAA